LDEDGTVRGVGAVAALAVGLLGSAAVVGAGELLQPAAGASCAVMTIATASNSLVRLAVTSVSVSKGGCVEFANTTSAPVQVTVVGTTYSRTVPANATTSGSSNYQVTKSVTVQASSGLRSGSGTITARSPSPAPTHTSTPTPTPRATRSTSPPVSATSSPSPAASHRRHRRGHRLKVSLPPLPPLPTDGLTTQPPASNPVVAPGLTSATAAPSQPTPSSHTTGTATVVEPATGSDRGLPVLLAAVLLVGLVAAYGRVLLGYAPAVDNRPSHPHRA